MQPVDPQTQYDTLKSAVLGATQTGTADPAGGNWPSIARLYSSDFAAPQATAEAGAGVGLAQQQVAEQKAAAAAASSGGGRSGGGGFKIQARPDGGFGYYAPDGTEVSASVYAAATGKDVATVLKNSKNPIDQAFIQDYKQLQDYINNKKNSQNNPQARSAAQAVETQVRKLYGIQLHQANPNDVINAFIKAYPTIYGQGATATDYLKPGFGDQAGKQGTNRLIPSNTFSRNGRTVNNSKTKSSYGISGSGGIP